MVDILVRNELSSKIFDDVDKIQLVKLNVEVSVRPAHGNVVPQCAAYVVPHTQIYILVSYNIRKSI